jgi:hypothetical protein
MSATLERTDGYNLDGTKRPRSKKEAALQCAPLLNELADGYEVLARKLQVMALDARRIAKAIEARRTSMDPEPENGGLIDPWKNAIEGHSSTFMPGNVPNFDYESVVGQTTIDLATAIDIATGEIEP